MQKYVTNNLISLISQKLLESYTQDKHFADQTAWWLVQKITGKNKASLLAESTIEWSQDNQKQLETFLDQLINDHKPLAYILGSVPFGQLDILVKPPILIPRPETEEWCMALIETLKPLKNEKLLILDIGTGTGCIALALAHALPAASMYALDSNPAALALAQENARHNQIPYSFVPMEISTERSELRDRMEGNEQNTSLLTPKGVPSRRTGGVTFLQSDLFSNLDDLTFDLIVSNPPYIPEHNWQNLDKSVSQWEDYGALIAQKNGTAILEKIISSAPRHLRANQQLEKEHVPQLTLEVDETHAGSVAALMKEKGYQQIRVHTDAFGKERVVSGRIQNVATSTDPG